MSDSDIVKDFLVESYENLDRLDRDLVELEKNPKDGSALAGVFRTIHTIKGTCGFLGFNKLEKVAHVGENLLSRLREGQLTLTPEITTGLLSMVDAVRQMLKEIDATGQDGAMDYPELRETLTQLTNGSPGEGAPAEKHAETQAEPGIEPPRTTEAAQPKNAGPPPAQQCGEVHREMAAPAEPPSAKKEAAPAAEAPAKTVATAEENPAALPAAETRPRNAAPETIRVGVNLLDKLMTLVGELVLARNQLLQFANTSEDTTLQAVSQRMNLIATELQEEVMKTRMQPIGNIWGQFPRTVRDVALSCGKQVKIEMEGKETELDKTIIEAIKDPLTHSGPQLGGPRNRVAARRAASGQG